jgi:hypothetical protein
MDIVEFITTEQFGLFLFWIPLFISGLLAYLTDFDDMTGRDICETASLITMLFCKTDGLMQKIVVYAVFIITIAMIIRFIGFLLDKLIDKIRDNQLS